MAKRVRGINGYWLASDLGFLRRWAEYSPDDLADSLKHARKGQSEALLLSTDPEGITVTNGHLVPQHDDDMDPLVPTPQDYGFPERPTLQQRDCWEHQQRFLRRYAERGKLALSAGDVGISVKAVEKRRLLEEGSVNGEYRELPEEGQG